MKFLFLFILQIAFIKSFTQDIQTDRVAYYPFSGDANDQAGNNHGEVYGPTLIKDRFGNPNSAFWFDGINDFIEIQNNSLMNFGADENFSISLWVKIAENQRDQSGHNNEIIGKWNAYNYTGYPFAIRYWNKNAASSNQNKIFNLRYDSENCGNNPTLTASCQISTEEWHHIVMRKQGSEISHFQDGILMGTVHDNTNSGCDTKNNIPVFIGKRDLNSRYFTGGIDDISFYNRALTEKEIEIFLQEGHWSPPASSFTAKFEAFSFPEQTSPATIDFSNHTITTEVSCSSDLTNLIAHFSLSDGSNASVEGIHQTSGQTSNDFTKPVKYLIVNKNGCVEQEWIIMASKKEIDPKAEFLSFNVPQQTNPANIDTQTYTIELEVSCSSNLSNLVAEFTLSDGTYATVNGAKQVSGSSSNNFINPLKYVVKDNNGCFKQEWMIIVKLEDIADLHTVPFITFNIPNQTKETAIDSSSFSIKVTIPCGSDISNLAPTFTLEEGTSATITGKLQHSGATTNDFSSPVVYHVTNQEICLKQDWKVFVEYSYIILDSINLELNSFLIPNVITPNKDGINDSFIVGEYFQGSELSVFNRHGRKVYQSTYYKNDFNGHNLSAGVYFYLIRNSCLEEPFTGNITIIKNK